MQVPQDGQVITSGVNGIAVYASLGYEYQNLGIAVTPGITIYPSIYVYSQKAATFNLNCVFFNNTTSVASCDGTDQAVAANTWTRLTRSAVVVPNPADRMFIRARFMSGATFAAGEWFEVTMVSTTPGEYADGDSPNWVWNGTPGASPSTGPQI